MNVSEAVSTRRSIRAFLDTPVDRATLERILDKARMAPSGCNFQPWKATVLTGKPLRALQQKMLASVPQDPIEYSWSDPEQSDKHLKRLQQTGASMYGAMGITRQDEESRRRFSEANIYSYGAPVLLLCYFERFMGPPQWSDVGMWLQTIMLLAREEGLDTCAQEWMAFYARLIKEHIGVDDETDILFCGIAIGHRDPDAPINNFERDRVPLSEQIVFDGF